MTREETVRVRVKGGGAAAFATPRRALKLAAGEVAEKWTGTDDPITHAEFDAVLAPGGVFEIAPDTRLAPARSAKV